MSRAIVGWVPALEFWTLGLPEIDVIVDLYERDRRYLGHTQLWIQYSEIALEMSALNGRM